MAWPPHTREIEHYKNFVKDSLHKYANGKSLVCFILYKSDVVGLHRFQLYRSDSKKIRNRLLVIGYWLLVIGYHNMFKAKGL